MNKKQFIERMKKRKVDFSYYDLKLLDEEMKKVLGIPEEPLLLMPVGYPKD